jgi:hypothetical protein
MSENGTGEATTPLGKAADRIRASAQYLLGAFAAVGAVLAAGLQLGDVGDVSLDQNPVRFWMTFVGIAAAVLGITLAIAGAGGVSTKSHVDLSWLVQNPDSEATKKINEDNALRQGTSLDELRDQVNQAVTAASATFREVVELGDPGEDPAKQRRATGLAAKYEQQTATLGHLKRIRSDVLDVASYYRVKESYDQAKKAIVAGALIGSAGITAFAWGAHAPVDSDIDPGGVVPKTPSAVTVVLTDAGTQRFRDDIGATCDGSKVAAIAFDATGTTYTVVTEKTDDCEVARLSVSPDLGQVIPRVAEGGDPEQPAGKTAATP